VSLKLPNGENIDFSVDPKATGFNEVKKGDRVEVEYLESLGVSLQPIGSGRPVAKVQTYQEAIPGQEPSVAEFMTQDMTASVESIDAAERILTLRGPTGEALKLKIPPEVQGLERLKQGDQVMAEFTQAIALDVRKTG